mgnify:CR=1 FL=1
MIAPVAPPAALAFVTPIRKAIADIGESEEVIGTAIASAAGRLSPGRTPTIYPSKMPQKTANIAVGENASVKPRRMFSTLNSQMIYDV